MLENALIRRTDLRQTHRGWDHRVQYGQTPPKVLLHAVHDVPAERGFIRHSQEHAADLQPGIDLTLDAPHRSHQFRHALRRQIVRLDGDKHIVRRGQGVDDQHTQRRPAVQQNIVVLPLHTVHIPPKHRFTAHHIHQPYLHGGQTAVSWHKVKALMVVHDLRVVAGHCSRYYIVQDIGKGEGQIMGLALAQHLGEVALGVHIQQQDFLPLQREAGSQVVDGGAFADAALLVCYADYLWFRHFGGSLLS